MNEQTDPYLGLGLGLGLFYFLSYEWVSQICFKDQYTLWVHLTRPRAKSARPAATRSVRTGGVREDLLSLSAPFQN